MSLLKKILGFIPIYIGVTLIIFVLYHLSAPNPARMLLGNHASQAQIEVINAQLGLDKPYFYQYIDLLKSAFTFDFGRSWSDRQLISSKIMGGLFPTLALSLPAFVLSTFLGLFIALIVSYYRGRFIDRFFVFLCVLLMSVSSLTYILFSQWFFSYHLGWFEISGFSFNFPEILSYICLPIIIWVVLAMGPDVRFYRTLILDELYQDYVRTARAKGLSEFKILMKHVLRNALIPIFTYMMIQLPYLILGAILFESFFSIPGIGGLVIEAIRSEDFPMLKALTLISALISITVNLVIDFSYKIIDPRIK
jgi:peptide/nickel transport system permease protein